MTDLADTHISEAQAEAEGFSPILYTFANRQPAPELESLLAMFYTAVVNNTLGVMQALNSETGSEEVILVGVGVDAEGKTQCYPVARVMSMEDTFKFRAPDGKGGFYDPQNPEELKAVQDEMKPVDESLIDIPVE